MNFEGFVDVTVSKRKNRIRNNPVFASINDKGITFSRATLDGLSAEYVRVLLNNDDRKFALVPADEGKPFMKRGKNTQIVRWNSSIVNNIRELLPDGQKTNVRIQGRIEDGVALFDCNDLSKRRAGAKA